jgi:hypothetical protein
VPVPTRFCEILSRYLRTNNFASFTRQLNYYGFHKIAHSKGRGRSAFEFRHDKFQRDSPHLIGDIKRRTNVETAPTDDVDSLRSENEKLCARIRLLQNDLAESRQMVETMRKKLVHAEKELAALRSDGSLPFSSVPCSPFGDSSQNKRSRPGSPPQYHTRNTGHSVGGPLVDVPPLMPGPLSFIRAPPALCTPDSRAALLDSHVPVPTESDAEMLADFGLKYVTSSVGQPSTVGAEDGTTYDLPTTPVPVNMPRPGDVELFHNLVRRLEDSELAGMLTCLTLASVHAARHDDDPPLSDEALCAMLAQHRQACATMWPAEPIAAAAPPPPNPALRGAEIGCPVHSRASDDELQTLRRICDVSPFMKLFASLMALPGFAKAVEDYMRCPTISTVGTAAFTDEYTGVSMGKGEPRTPPHSFTTS